jgi:hypothetical protein
VQFPKSAGKVYSYVMQMLYTYVYVDSYDNIDACILTDFNEFCVFTSTYNGVDPPVKGIAKKIAKMKSWTHSEMKKDIIPTRC